MSLPEYVVGYEGTPVHYVDNGTAVAICGNGFCLYSLPTNKSNGGSGSGGHGYGGNRLLMWGPNAGLQTSAFHNQDGTLAFVDKGLPPAVHIHQMNYANRKIFTFTGLGELDVSVLAFSVSSPSRLVTASAVPDFRLILWNLEDTKGATKMAEGKLKQIANFASFSPVRNNQVCISGNGHLSIWTYEQQFHVVTWEQVERQCEPYRAHCHCWGADGDVVYAGCMEGVVVSFDVKYPPTKETPKPKTILTLGTGDRIVALCGGQNNLAAVTENGSCTWIGFPARKKKARATTAVEMKARVKAKKGKGNKAVEAAGQQQGEEWEALRPEDFRVVQQLQLGFGGVVSALYRGDEEALLVASSRGILASALIHRRQLLARIADVAHATVDPLVELTWQCRFHRGAILAMGLVCGGKVLVTCGEDGTVRSWAAALGKETSCQSLKSPQRVLCILSEFDDAFIVTGSLAGYMNVFHIQSTGDSKIVKQVKVHTRSIDQVIQSSLSLLCLH